MTPSIDSLEGIDVSVVVCVYNESGNILPLIEQIHHSLHDLNYELIYVNDGSTDQTLAELRSVKKYKLRILDLQKNYGQSLALMAGIEASKGQFIVTLDGDLQNDPADIPRLLQLADQGDYDLVAGIRANRQDHAVLRKLPSRLAGSLISGLTGLRWTDYGCSLKVFRADLAKRLKLYGELHRFIPVLAYLEGARMMQVPVQHHPRRVGQSKYGLNRTLNVLSDLMLLLFLKKYIHKPMHLVGSGGLLCMGLGIGLGAYGMFRQLMNEQGGTAFLLSGLICLFAGLQFIGLGFLTELQMRTYYESQGKKPYTVRRVYTNETSPYASAVVHSTILTQ